MKSRTAWLSFKQSLLNHTCANANADDEAAAFAVLRVSGRNAGILSSSPLSVLKIKVCACGGNGDV